MSLGISVRLHVALVAILYVGLLVYLWFWNDFDCGSTSFIIYLVLFTPSFVAACVAQAMLKRRSVQVVGATMQFLPGFLGWILLPISASECECDEMELAAWIAFPVLWVCSLGLGISLMKRAQTMPVDPQSSGFDIRCHALVAGLTYWLPVSFALFLFETGGHATAIIYWCTFPPAIICWLLILTDRDVRYIHAFGMCSFVPGFFGWILLPMAACFNNSEADWTIGVCWAIFPTYFTIGLGTGCRLSQSSQREDYERRMRLREEQAVQNQPQADFLQQAQQQEAAMANQSAVQNPASQAQQTGYQGIPIGQAYQGKTSTAGQFTEGNIVYQGLPYIDEPLLNPQDRQPGGSIQGQSEQAVLLPHVMAPEQDSHNNDN